MLVAIGGGPMKSSFVSPVFFWFASSSLREARQARGCQMATVFQNPVGYFSLTVWDAPADMKRFAASGLHARAMRIERRLFKWSYFHHYQTDEMPTQKDAFSRWKAAGECRAA